MHILTFISLPHVTFCFFFPRLFSSVVLLAHRLVPSKVHGAPAEIELQLKLKPNAATSITIEFEKSFLNIDDFPPDVSRGFDVSDKHIF